MGMKPETVADYLDHLPTSSRQVVEQIRSIIDEIVPEALHRISYGIPAFRQDGRNFFYFGVWKDHIGAYPIYPGPPAFEERLAAYRHGKDTVRFMLRDHVPHALLTELVEVMAARNRGPVTPAAPAGS